MNLNAVSTDQFSSQHRKQIAAPRHQHHRPTTVRELSGKLLAQPG
jgi:hypothetical protein